jgi:hypothetical protein
MTAREFTSITMFLLYYSCLFFIVSNSKILRSSGSMAALSCCFVKIVTFKFTICFDTFRLVLLSFGQ